MTNIFIVLLRGVNVGGSTPFSMKDFVRLLEATGLRNIKTYIQTGNAVFLADTKDAAGLAKKIKAGIQRKHAFAPGVIVLRLDEFKRALANNPYREADSNPKALHVMFLASTPKKVELATFEKYRAHGEEFSLKGRVLYFWAPDGVGRSKLFSRVEKLLGVAVTARNWRTACRILELSRDANATDTKPRDGKKQTRRAPEMADLIRLCGRGGEI